MKSTYLSLLSYTDQGARNVQDSAHRAKTWRQQVESAGVTVVAQLWTIGEYDGALLLQGEEEQILRALAHLVSLGNVRCHTLRALDAEEFASLLTP